jgi:hypothetical protein
MTRFEGVLAPGTNVLGNTPVFSDFFGSSVSPRVVAGDPGFNILTTGMYLISYGISTNPGACNFELFDRTSSTAIPNSVFPASLIAMATTSIVKQLTAGQSIVLLNLDGTELSRNDAPDTGVTNTAYMSIILLLPTP